MECVYEARRQLQESASWPTAAAVPSANQTTAPSPSPAPVYGGGGHSPTSGQQLSPVGEVEEEEEEEEICKITSTYYTCTYVASFISNLCCNLSNLQMLSKSIRDGVIAV